MRYVVTVGECALYDYTNEETGERVVIRTAEYILQELQRDGLSLTVPVFHTLLDASPIDTDQLTAEEQEDVRRKRMKELERAVVHDLFALKGAYLLRRIADVNLRIKALQNEGRIDEAIELMKEQKQLNEIKVALSRELGERIILKM